MNITANAGSGNRAEGLSRSRSQSASESDLNEKIAEQARDIASLQERRAMDLDRLREISRARDLLEARLALQQGRTAEALAKAEEKEKALEQIDQRVGGALLLGPSESDGDASKSRRSSPLGDLGGRAEMMWWGWTLRAARRSKAKGRLIEAQLLFDAALLSRESASVWTELAHVLRERKLFDSAEAAYERSLELDPKNAENIFLAGYCAEMCGRKEQASRQYEEALARNPKLIERYDHLRDYNARLFG